MKNIRQSQHVCRFGRKFIPRWSTTSLSNNFLILSTHRPQPIPGPTHRASHCCKNTVTPRRTFTSGATSYSVDNCPYRSFARAHPEVAMRVLSVPSFSYQDLLSSDEQQNSLPLDENLEFYLQWRGWDVERILNDYKLDNKLVPSAIGLLSHPLTFPLTLGKHIKDLSTPPFDGSNKQQHLRICCVGARAECTLPGAYWREFLVAALCINHTNNSNQQCGHQSFHCTIDFVGPDVPSQLKSKTIALFDNTNECLQQQMPQYEMTMNYHTSFLHEVVLKLLKSSHATTNDSNIENVPASDRTEQIRQYWDAYVLFNPGIGHPNLQKQWGPTLKFLVKTRKPILLTAHSSIDAERDHVVLENLLIDAADRYYDRSGSAEYSMNSFASRMTFVDPIPLEGDEDTPVHIVQPNHYAFLLQ